MTDPRNFISNVSDFNNPVLVDHHLLIIGGSGRNVGKTTLALEIIRKYAKTVNLTGLKLSSHNNQDKMFHGSHHPMDVHNFSIWVETCLNDNKDTARMIFAGAKQSFYIESPDTLIYESYMKFNELYKPVGPIICESKSLRKFVKPGLFIFLVDPLKGKDHTHEYEAVADYVHYFNPIIPSFNDLVDQIEYINTGWKLKHSP